MRISTTIAAMAVICDCKCCCTTKRHEDTPNGQRQSNHGDFDRRRNDTGFRLLVAADADDERSLRTRKVCPSAASNLDRGEADAHVRSWERCLLVSRPRPGHLLSPRRSEDYRPR